MATGDSGDIQARVKRLIPNRWFAWVAPIRDAILGGLSDSAAWSYSLYQYAVTQHRIATSTGVFLDLISYDFLGRFLPRNGNTDAVFKAQIVATILQERVTRKGMINAITTLTGTPPVIFEPWNTGDAGAWSGGAFKCGQLGYGVGNGGWGSVQLQGQFFITVTRGQGSGVPMISGYAPSPASAAQAAHIGAGGYGVGAISYFGASTSQVGVTNQIIDAMIQTTKPSGTLPWVNFN